MRGGRSLAIEANQGARTGELFLGELVRKVFTNTGNSSTTGVNKSLTLDTTYSTLNKETARIEQVYRIEGQGANAESR